MKITIAYLPGEEPQVTKLKNVMCIVLGDAKVHESDRHAPFKHIYLTTRKAEKHSNSKGST